MAEFDTVEDTLFVPMLGRIYASEHYPNVLCDKKALELKAVLPKNIKGQDTQTDYTYMASASRSVNMDRAIQDFMKRNEDGVIVMLGAGLETTYFRNDNGVNEWYEVDLPDVIKYRRELLGESERDHVLPMSAFSSEWIEAVRAKHKDAPILVTASGLFYYFEKNVVEDLFKMLKAYGNIEVVFDTVNKSGMKRMSYYMDKVGHSDATMYFYVDNAEELAKAIGATSVIEEKYYTHINKKGLKFSTAMTMRMSDLFNMVKMVYVKLN